MAFIFSTNTTVSCTPVSEAVLRHAQAVLTRDLHKVVTASGPANEVVLQLIAGAASEAFTITASDQRLLVQATTVRGVMYGALALSRDCLGVDDWWYFAHRAPQPHPTVTYAPVPQPHYQVPYRGWFVNDELLLMTYQDGSNDYVWDRIYETLLRNGGNLIIPGTDKISHLHRQAAQGWGLWYTHHHAEPLGAAMFARVYPHLQASYLQYPELFEALWTKALQEQAGSGVVYALGFRGQGDKPFWADEADRVWDDQAKAAVINDVIAKQYALVQHYDPQAPCCLNVYGELTALVNAGLIKLPAGVIEIWADNGYGAMVSRRQGLANPREAALCKPDGTPRGIYYHVAFHDLQASNFLTMLPNPPALVAEQLMQVRAHRMDTLCLVNTGNVKMHLLFLRLVAQWWQGDLPQADAALIGEYVAHYYEHDQAAIAALYQQYFATTIQYGPHADDHAGDEFYYYLTRRVIKAWLSHSTIPRLGWLTAATTLDAQVQAIANLIQPAVAPWQALAQAVQRYADDPFLYNDLGLSVWVHAAGVQMLQQVLAAYQAPEPLAAFMAVQQALEANQALQQRISANPVVKWRRFYANDGYDDLAMTQQTLQHLRGYLRLIGDSADLDGWHRQYVMPEADRRVMLLSNTHPALDDEALAENLEDD